MKSLIDALPESENIRVSDKDAVYKANVAVKEEYNAISAWACMHMYGNPYLQINEVPSLSINMK